MSSPQLPFALSPDGSQLRSRQPSPMAFGSLWIRPLASLDARTLPGAESVRSLRFSGVPTAAYRIWRSQRKLKKIDVSGRPVQTLCDFSLDIVGGTWNREGVIIFGIREGGQRWLMRVSEDGGVTTSLLTTIDCLATTSSMAFHLSFLMGSILFISRHSRTPENSGIYVGSLDTEPGEQDLKQLVATDYWPSTAPSAGPVRPVLFLRDGALLAQPFDARRLVLDGRARPARRTRWIFPTYSFFSASTKGDPSIGSAVEPSQARNSHGMTGRESPWHSWRTGPLPQFSLSPDGTRAFVSALMIPSNSVADTLGWLTSRGVRARGFTFGSFNSATFGTWSPDGSRIIFVSNRRGEFVLYQKRPMASSEEVLLKSSDDKFPTSWSRDGRFLLYINVDSWTQERQQSQQRKAYGCSP